MSSLFRRELLHTIRRESTGASHRCSYSVASKKRKGQPRPASPVSALAPNAPRPSAAEPVYTSPSPSPQPNPPPPSPPPSWRWPFSSGSSSSSTRNPAVDVAALDDAKHYDLTKQASWADPPLVAQARTKTVRQRNVFESFLVLPPETRLKLSLALFAVGLVGLYAGDWLVPETEQERQVREGKQVELPPPTATSTSASLSGTGRHGARAV